MTVHFHRTFHIGGLQGEESEAARADIERKEMARLASPDPDAGAEHPSLPDCVCGQITAIQMEVEQMLGQAFMMEGMTVPRLHGVAIAVREALVNAFVHGSWCDPEELVMVSVCVEAECRGSSQSIHLAAVVADSGDGFDRSAVPDCTARENLERPTGRGICIMGHFANPEWNEKGNVCTIRQSWEQTPGHREEGAA
ncbi:MAG: anti-sigma regulatory factor, serine/threonine protein kinase [Candidatus Peregrinibacteria bacterium Greene0416_19]|nr:MAG: anti-sigma regulatory factor, serine/threonine protein kinase [Candidatus Peregrinibacteria bacterium Greene0416_19]